MDSVHVVEMAFDGVSDSTLKPSSVLITSFSMEMNSKGKIGTYGFYVPPPF